MPHSLLLSHDKFMLHKLRPPRFAMSCNSTKKREKDPLVNSPITKPPLSFGMEVVHVLFKRVIDEMFSDIFVLFAKGNRVSENAVLFDSLKLNIVRRHEYLFRGLGVKT